MESIEHPARKHHYTTTNSGVNVYKPGSFQACEVRLSDIMDGLSKICRYNGQVNTFYSVAEHSVLVSRYAEIMGDTPAVLPALFHDAHEAYSGDIPTPHKSMIAGAREFEDAYELVVREALGLPGPEDEVWQRVRQYDTAILHRELIVLRDKLPNWYDPQIESIIPPQLQPVGHEWREAREMFRHRMQDLGYSRD